ncbi:MAG: PaaI family thioesterase [Burkholderiales bacterium]
MTVDELQAQWLAQEQTIRQRIASAGGKAGLATPDMLAGKTGLQQMQAMLDGAAPYPHIADTMDFFLVEVAEGRAVFQGTPQLRHYNPLGSVHGGWYGTLLDSCMGCAVHTTMAAGRAYTTAEYSINIVRSASHKTGPLRAIGSVLHTGRQLATAEGRIVGTDGKLYAHATTTCLVFEYPPR